MSVPARPRPALRRALAFPARLLALALAVSAATAEAQSLRGLDALDRRGELLGWEAVGRLDTPRGYCTGTLIATDVVLTAAHCVHGLAPAAIRFRAGYAHGRSFADRRVTRVALPAAYVHSTDGRLDPETIPHDVALLRLDAGVSSAEADPFRIQSGGLAGDVVSVLSYGSGRSETLSRQAECRLTDRWRGGILGFDCNVTFGSSGAPVFLRRDGRLRIVSLISGGAGGTALGMDLGDAVAPLMRELTGARSRAKPSAGARRVRVGDADKRPSGARFVRP